MREPGKLSGLRARAVTIVNSVPPSSDGEQRRAYAICDAIDLIAVADLKARIVRATEALEDGDSNFAYAILEDLLVEWAA